MKRAFVHGSLAIAVLAVAGMVLLATWRREDGRLTWTRHDDDLDTLTGIALTLHPSDGSNDQRSTTLDELRSRYPLAIELPHLLPEGYQLFAIDYIEAGHRANPRGPSVLRIGYAASDGDEIAFMQSAGDQMAEGDGAEAISVRGVPGQYWVRPEPVPLDWVVWARCGRVFSVSTSPLGGLSRDDLVSIAESVGPEECD